MSWKAIVKIFVIYTYLTDFFLKNDTNQMFNN